MGDATCDPTTPAVGAKTHFKALDQGNSIIAEYIWIGGSGEDLRSKARTITTSGVGVTLKDLPVWNFDGSSTGQAPGHDSEVLIKPRAIFLDPFRQGENILVLCDCHQPLDDGKMVPIPSNTREAAAKIFSDPRVDSEATWYGMEQEYTLFNSDNRTVLGWPSRGYPAPQGQYYCGVGTDSVFGRSVLEAHYRACLHAGVKIAGVNAEVMPGQWEFQIGPCQGISAGDHLWMARYLMHRVCEEFQVICNFDPKPIPGDWNGAGCHFNYSTKTLREDGGWKKVEDKWMPAFEDAHAEHIEVYGEGNERRLTGLHETASIHKFSYGVANRGCSFRIPRNTAFEGKGYIEDRRPASNCDPYLVAAKIAETSLIRAYTPDDALVRSVDAAAKAFRAAKA